MTMPRPRLLSILLVALASGALAGCLACEPVLEVQRCHSGVRDCDPDPADVRDWTAEHAEAWPELDALLTAMDDEHGHAGWTAEKEDAFWTYWSMDPDAPEKDLYVEHADTVYRVRVITCD